MRQVGKKVCNRAFEDLLVILVDDNIISSFLGQCYSAVKKALHTGAPKSLLCREKELETIQTFLHSHLSKQKPGSLYISGAPGTGKTACLTKVMKQLEVSTSRLKYLNICSSSN